MERFGKEREILRSARRAKDEMWREFEAIRPGLLAIAREVYPAAITSLSAETQDFAARKAEEIDEDRRRLTSIPFEAFRIGASGFHVNLTSPARKWFSLKVPSFGASVSPEAEGVRRFSERLTDATRWLIAWSGAYRSLAILYRHLLAFGFGCILTQPDDERIVYSECLRMGTYAFGVNRRGHVDRVARKFAFTAEQLIDEFGRDALPENILKEAADGSLKRHEVWNLIEPHQQDGPGGDPRGWRLPYEQFSYRSVYWADGMARDGSSGSNLLAVRGSARKPFVAPRLEYEAGDVYGRGRGAAAVGLCRGLQQLCEDRLDISGMAAQPAVVVSADLEGDVQLGRCGINYASPGDQRNQAIYRALADPPHAQELDPEMGRLADDIRALFYNGEFTSISEIKARPGVKTATEVEQIVRENMEQLSAIVTTLDDELLDPFVSMYMAWVLDSGIVEMPEEMNGQPLDIRYESVIHRAQQAADIGARNSSMSFALQVANARPDVLDNFDFDRMSREMHRSLGGSELDLVPSDVIQRQREARAQEQAKMQGQQEAAMQAQTFRELASAPVTDQSLGGRLVGAMAGTGA